MSGQTDQAKIADAFERSGCGWILKYPDRKEILAGVAQQIGEFISEYSRRFKETPDPFALLDQNPPNGAAFFQAFSGAKLSLDMRIMIWRMLLGSEILAVQFHYTRDQDAELRISIRSPYGDPEPDYCSKNLWDFAVLRHLGILTVNGNPVLDGYYALRQP